MDKQTISKEVIIAEYLAGGTTLRKLAAKYNLSHQGLNKWVQTFQGRRRTKTEVKISRPGPPKMEPLPVEVKNLQKELRKAELHNQLLNAMIDIAEEQLGVPIRKKSGTKQS